MDMNELFDFSLFTETTPNAQHSSQAMPLYQQSQGTQNTAMGTGYQQLAQQPAQQYPFNSPQATTTNFTPQPPRYPTAAPIAPSQRPLGDPWGIIKQLHQQLAEKDNQIKHWRDIAIRTNTQLREQAAQNAQSQQLLQQSRQWHEKYNEQRQRALARAQYNQQQAFARGAGNPSTTANTAQDRTFAAAQHTGTFPTTHSSQHPGSSAVVVDLTDDDTLSPDSSGAAQTPSAPYASPKISLPASQTTTSSAPQLHAASAASTTASTKPGLPPKKKRQLYWMPTSSSPGLVAALAPGTYFEQYYDKHREIKTSYDSDAAAKASVQRLKAERAAKLEKQKAAAQKKQENERKQAPNEAQNAPEKAGGGKRKRCDDQEGARKQIKTSEAATDARVPEDAALQQALLEERGAEDTWEEEDSENGGLFEDGKEEAEKERKRIEEQQERRRRRIEAEEEEWNRRRAAEKEEKRKELELLREWEEECARKRENEVRDAQQAAEFEALMNEGLTQQMQNDLQGMQQVTEGAQALTEANLASLGDDKEYDSDGSEISEAE